MKTVKLMSQKKRRVVKAVVYNFHDEFKFNSLNIFLSQFGKFKLSALVSGRGEARGQEPPMIPPNQKFQDREEKW